MMFRCYAFRTGGRWHGICTDLDIAVDDRSYQGVKASLATCTEMYLEGVVESQEDERRWFLTRRAPWLIRVRLALVTWVHQLFRNDGEERMRLFFLVPPVGPSQQA